MPVSKKAEIDQLAFRIVEVINVVFAGKKLIKIATDPLNDYFKVAGGMEGIVSAADGDLQKLLKISLQARNFGKPFKVPASNHWRDAGWLIANLTEGNVGRKVENQSGIVTLQDFKDKVTGVSQMTEAADNFAVALMVYLGCDFKQLAGSLVGANPMILKEIKTINLATRADLARFKLIIDQAIMFLGKM